MTLADCYNHQLMRVELCNLQTRMLGWSPDHQLRLPCADERDQIDFAATHARYLHSPINMVTLQRAIDRLRTEIDYGILERPDSIVAMIARITGSDAEIKMPHLNVTNQVEYEVTTAELELIRRNNSLDHALYTKGYRDAGRQAKRIGEIKVSNR
jgi:hypothetical protein